MSNVERRSVRLAVTRRTTRLWLVVLGVTLLVVFAIPASLMFFPIGHPYCEQSADRAACEAEAAALSQLAVSQGRLGFFGYPAAMLLLIAVAFRDWRAWAAVIAVSVAVVLAGVFPILAGFWDMTPQVLGVSVPLVSPGVTFWIAPALAFAAAGLAGVARGYRRNPN